MLCGKLARLCGHIGSSSYNRCLAPMQNHAAQAPALCLSCRCQCAAGLRLSLQAVGCSTALTAVSGPWISHHY